MHDEIPSFVKASFKKLPVNRRRLSQGMAPYQPWLSLWLVRLTLIMGWHKKLKPGHRRRPFISAKDDDFMNLLGVVFPEVDEEDDDEDDEYHLSIDGADSKQSIRDKMRDQCLKARLEELQQKQWKKPLPLFSNIDGLGKILSLSEADKAILLFAASFVIFDQFRDVISAQCVRVPTDQLPRLLAAFTGLPFKDIQRSLKPDADLMTSGLIRIKQNTDLEEKLELMEGLGLRLLEEYSSDQALISMFLKPAAEGSLTLEDFPHLASDTELCRDYLAGVLKSGAHGCNLLLSGPPGTGKTEFTLALARHLGVQIYEVAYAGPQGAPIRGVARLQAYSLCQRLLGKNRRAILLFDEIEDVLPPRRDGFNGLFGDDEDHVPSPGKAWINRTLENNRVPAIWVTNHTGIDNAYLRRFDYSVRFPIPPHHVRMLIARQHLVDFSPSEDWLMKITANDSLSPDQISRAAKVARLVSKGKKSRRSALGCIEQTLDRSASLLQQKITPVVAVSTRYNLDYLNTDSVPAMLVQGLARQSSASLCFFGPPGTGKTELGRFIARELGKPLMVRRASDIFSKWVGDSEKNIAEMFAEARQQQSVLLLDEADSFLADRRGSSHSWEVTQVNELLTQMEVFDGIFIATTNLMEKLDAASLRRFAVKVRFDYLRPDQTWNLFQQEVLRLNTTVTDLASVETEVRRLERVAPGDVAAVVRQCRLWDQPPTARRFLEALRKDLSARGGSMHSIGFMH